MCICTAQKWTAFNFQGICSRYIFPFLIFLLDSRLRGHWLHGMGPGVFRHGQPIPRGVLGEFKTSIAILNTSIKSWMNSMIPSMAFKSIMHGNRFVNSFALFIILVFQIFTYVIIGLGFTLFFSGLIGWVGGASESPCLVRLFLIAVVLSIIAEIGGIISLNIVRLEVFKQSLCDGANFNREISQLMLRWSSFNLSTKKIVLWTLH